MSDLSWISLILVRFLNRTVRFSGYGIDPVLMQERIDRTVGRKTDVNYISMRHEYYPQAKWKLKSPSRTKFFEVKRLAGILFFSSGMNR